MNARFLRQSGNLISKFASVHTGTLFCINSRSIYYAAHPYPNDTVKKLMKFLKDNKEQLDYVPPPIMTVSERNQISDNEILNLTEDQERKLRLIKWEYELLKERYPHLVPKEVNNSLWIALLDKKTPSQRQTHLYYLRSIEVKRKNQTEKKKSAKLIVPEPIFKDKISLWLQRATINSGYNERIYESLMNGPHCVVDMGFENFMSERELKNTVQQVNETCTKNKLNAEPFHITFTDLERDKFLHTHLSHTLPKCYIKTEASFMDIFPTEKLVYLTPDSPNEMKVYDPESIYVIGGMVDLSLQGTSTLAKAKRLQIRTAKFPIDSYVLWEKGRKSLTLNQVFNILHCVKDCGDWLKAFRHIPKRKLKNNYT